MPVSLRHISLVLSVGPVRSHGRGRTGHAPGGTPTRGGTVGPLCPPSRRRSVARSRRAQTVSAVPRTASTASTTNPANQARIVMYAVPGTDWLLIRSVPIRVIW